MKKSAIGIILGLLSISSIFAQETTKTAYFASGCFWCVEPIYEHLVGVTAVVSGYAGGYTKNPTYQQVSTGKTGHSETVKVIYNPQEISFKTLIEVYFGTQNVSQQNGQGPDIGNQYRSIIFYQTPEEKQIIEAYITQLSKQFSQPIAAEVKSFDTFWPAEDYHQDYKKKNPNVPYIKGVSEPRYNRFKKKFSAILK